MLRRKAVIGLVLVLAMVAASCGSDDDSSDTTTAPLTTEAPVTTTAAPTKTAAAVVEFDLVSAVSDYTTTIPDGFMSVGDTTAFKDAMDTGGAYVIDVREIGEYEEGHIPGAVNIPLRTLTENLDKIPTDRQVFIYCKSGFRAGLGTSSLRMLGYDNVVAYPPGWNGWTEANETVSTDAVAAETFAVPDIAPELYAAVNGFVSTIPEGWLSAGNVTAVKDAIDAGAFVLDVRTEGEFAEGRIPGAVNVNLRSLVEGLDLIPTDRQVISYCKSGWRAGLSIPVLHVLGIDSAKAFPGSYLAWTEAGEPVES